MLLCMSLISPLVALSQTSLVDSILADVRRFEGLSLVPYPDFGDSTLLIIGYGTALPITATEADVLLRSRLRNFYLDLERRSLMLHPTSVRSALLHMSYQLGVTGLLRFRRMIHALARRDYCLASVEAADSRWAIRYRRRALFVVSLFKEACADAQTPIHPKP